MLILSDLHLGKSERMARRGGALLPPYETLETLDRLQAEIAATDPAVVVSLGDGFDDDAAAPERAARLVRMAAAPEDRITLTDEQEAIASLAPGHGPVLVLGAPGTGRTTVAVEYAARRIEAGLDPESLLLLAPSRDAAARLRDALPRRLASAGRGTRAVTPVRTWSSYAFDLLRRARVTGPLRHLEVAPRLLTGAEQDTVIELNVTPDRGYCLSARGLARELARMNLPANVYTQWYWKTDLHNLFHFLRLRADPHAQYEIRVYAEAMCQIVRDWVPLAYTAFEDYRLGGAVLSAKGVEVLKRRLAGEAVTQESSGMSKGEWREFEGVWE